MPMTNFPFGVSSFGMPIVGAGPIMTTGNVFFVSSTSTGKADATSNGRDPATPFATIDYAVGQCTASQGDVIIVMPGHVETIATAGALALDVAGITVIGLGNKRNRPIIDFTATAGTMTISAANVQVQNVHFRGSIDAVVAPITISGADCEMFNFTWQDASATQPTNAITTTAGASRLHLHDFEYDGDTAAGTQAGIAIVGGDGIKIHDFIADGNFSVGFIDVRTTATTDLKVFNCWSFRTRNAADIFLVDTITASTGQIGPNLFLRLNDNAANITEAITGATFVQHLPISVVNLAGEIGMPINTTASTDA